MGLDNSLIKDLQITRPSLNMALFPSVQALEVITGDMRLAGTFLTFVPASLKSLDVWLEGDVSSETAFIKLLPYLFPTLATLKLYGVGQHPVLHPVLASTISRLTLLRHITLACAWLSPPLMSSLSALQHLETLHARWRYQPASTLSTGWVPVVGSFGTPVPGCSSGV